ncbi:unnamed protein product [Phytophthora fragariaefolia]|uniref:Unnamed protein product n=1 Tax=Phytophthora fragariaefolia TaxID=1490495 RepID=A0A9W6Y8E4_9STRA|nr:unnamed protein product [Phytophthora fragariaefolia]
MARLALEKVPRPIMANVAQHLTRLQLGASGARHRRLRRLNDAPPVTINACSVSLQRSSLQFSLLTTLNCPAQRVLALGEGPEVPINGQTTGFLPSGPAFQVAYASHQPLLAAVDEEGAVGIVDVALGRRIGRWEGHDNAIFDVIWTQGAAQVLTAAGDLQIRLWDVETAASSAGTDVAPVSTLRGHDMSVKCIRQAPDSAHVFASGGRDGKVLLWDTRTAGKPTGTLENIHAEPTSSRASSPNASFMSPIQKRRRRGPAAPSTSSPRSVTCVEFGATGKEIITAGAVDAVVKFWDLRHISTRSSSSTVGRGKKKTVAKEPVPIREISCSTREGSRRGISSLTLRKGGAGGAGGASRLLVNVLSDSLAVIDLGQQQHETKTLLRCFGHQATSFYNRATFSPDGDFIAAASADSVVYLWDARVSTSYENALTTASVLGIEQRAPCLALRGHVSEVNGVAWSSRDFTQLASCSDDGTVRCWQIGGERERTRHRQALDESAKAFKLQLAPRGDSSEADKKTGWANWDEFVEQPEGFAYRVRGNEPAAPQVTQILSPRRRRVPVAHQHKSPPRVTRHSVEPRLHPVYEAPTAQQQPQQEPRGTQEAQPQQKRRVKLRRKKQLVAQPKRAQRTLLELWGK